MIKVAINGFGRIGRLVFRLMEEDPSFEVVAINDLTDAEQLAYLLKYDTSHRRYSNHTIEFDENNIIVNGRKIRVCSETEPKANPSIPIIAPISRVKIVTSIIIFHII